MSIPYKEMEGGKGGREEIRSTVRGRIYTASTRVIIAARAVHACLSSLEMCQRAIAKEHEKQLPRLQVHGIIPLLFFFLSTLRLLTVFPLAHRSDVMLQNLNPTRNDAAAAAADARRCIYVCVRVKKTDLVNRFHI